MSVSYVAHTRLKTQTLPISSVYFSHLFHKDHHTMQNRLCMQYVQQAYIKIWQTILQNQVFKLVFSFCTKKVQKSQILRACTCRTILSLSPKKAISCLRKKGIKIGLSIIFIVHTIWFFETSYFTELQLIKMSKSAQYTISHKTTKENAIL